MKAITFDLLEVAINIATQSFETPFKELEIVTVKGVMLTWQELNSWFEPILWTCFPIDENNKWGWIHWEFMKNFVVKCGLNPLGIYVNFYRQKCNVNVTG